MTELDNNLARDLALTETVQGFINLLRTRAGLTRVDIAIATRASTSAVRNWEVGYNQPRTEYGHRLIMLVEVVSVLSETLTPRGIHQWLNLPNRELNGMQPIKMIPSGRALEAAQFLVGDGIV